MNDKIEGPEQKREDFLEPKFKGKLERIGRDAKWTAIVLGIIAL